MDDSKFLKPKDVAVYFGVTLPTVRRWIEQDKLPAIRTPGGRIRILADKFYTTWQPEPDKQEMIL
jgi:excisionase family DNA binding protein